MKFVLQRLYYTKNLTTGNYTCGFLTNEDETFRSFVLEDQPREQKIKGETRIPAGIYELGLQKSDTPLTLKHREAYKDQPFFKANPKWYHIEIKGIPNYSGVYVHSGNDDSHTMGCLLPCYLFDMSLPDKQGGKSLVAVNDFYALCYPLLEKGEKITITIKD